MKLDIAQLALLAGTPVSLGLVASWIAARRVLDRRMTENDKAWEERLADAVAKTSEEERTRSTEAGQIDPADVTALRSALDERSSENEQLKARLVELEAAAEAAAQAAAGQPTADPKGAPQNDESAALRDELSEWQQRCRGLQVIQRQAEERLRAFESGTTPEPADSGALEQLQEEVEQLRHLLSESETQREALQARCQELSELDSPSGTESHPELQTQLSDAMGRLEETELALARTREELAEATRVIDTHEPDPQGALADVQLLERKLAEARSDLAALRDSAQKDPRIAALTARLAEREAEVEARAAKIKALDERYAEALIDLESTAREEIDGLKLEIATVKEALETTAAERTSLAEDADKFRSAFRSREQDLLRRKQELEALQAESSQLRDEVDRSDRERSRLETELEEAATRHGQLSQLNEKLYTFQNELLAANADLEENKSELEVLRAESDTLREDLKRKRRERAALESTLEETQSHRDQLAELNERLYSFQNELLAANADLEAKTQEIGRLVTQPAGQLRTAS